jgi:fructose/tagatose bisphosphate aldolase
LQPGTYYVGWNCNNTTAKFTSIAGTAALEAVVNANSPIILEGTSGTAASAGQNPSSLGTLTAANVADILFCVFQ